MGRTYEADNLFQHAVADRLQVREDHGHAAEIALGCAHRKEDRDAAIFHAVLVAHSSDLSFAGEGVERVQHQIVLVGSEHAPSLSHKQLALFVVERNRVQPHRR